MNVPIIYVFNFYINQLGNTTNYFVPGNVPQGSGILSGTNFSFPGFNPALQINSSFPVNPVYQGKPLIPIDIPANFSFLVNSTEDSTIVENSQLPINPILPLTSTVQVPVSTTSSPPITQNSRSTTILSVSTDATTTEPITEKTTSTTKTTTPSIPSEVECFPQPGDTCGTFQGSQSFIYESRNSVAKINQNPWNILLEYETDNNARGFYCGGTIINKRYVITAASCVDLRPDWSLIGVRLGEWAINSSTDCEWGTCADPTYDIEIEEVIRHEQYTRNSKDKLHDIALLRLADEIHFNNYVAPICLPIAQHLRNINYTEVKLEVVGWITSLTKQSNSDSKRHDTVKGITLEDCNTLYNQRDIEIKDSQICVADKDEVVTCSGDDGGPLIVQNDINTVTPYYYLAGIGSINVAPCDESYPGVYTNVGLYIDWIERNVCK